MDSPRDWKSSSSITRATGAPDLPQHTIDELAAHLEDIYLDAVKGGRSKEGATRAAQSALAESSLKVVPRSEPAGRKRVPSTKSRAAAGYSASQGTSSSRGASGGVRRRSLRSRC